MVMMRRVHSLGFWQRYEFDVPDPDHPTEYFVVSATYRLGSGLSTDRRLDRRQLMRRSSMNRERTRSFARLQWVTCVSLVIASAGCSRVAEAPSAACTPGSRTIGSSPGAAPGRVLLYRLSRFWVRVVPGLTRVLEVLPEARSAWRFLTEESPFLDPPQRPLDLLKAGRIDEVVNAAHAHTEAFT